MSSSTPPSKKNNLSCFCACTTVQAFFIVHFFSLDFFSLLRYFYGEKFYPSRSCGPDGYSKIFCGTFRSSILLRQEVFLMKKFLLALLTAVTAAAFFCGAAASVATYSASYDAPAGINAIVVKDNSAAVILQAADIDHIRADYTYTSSYAFESSKLYDFTVAGSTLTVTKTREPNSSLIIQSEDTRSCTLTLQVPRQTLANITVSTTNDSITLNGVSAQTASLTTDNGRIEVSNFNGSTLSGTTRNGKITMSGVTSQNVAATIQNSGTLKLENISANVCNAKVQNGSITGSVIGSGSSYGFELAAGGGKIRVSDASDKNFLFFGKDTLQQNADAPNKLNLATKNGDVEVEFVR
jgi:hypothetical protein